MKKTFVISFILLILSNFNIGYGQVCGQFVKKYDERYIEIPLIKVSYELETKLGSEYERSDSNGEFELEIPIGKNLSDLYFENTNGLIVRIKSVPLKQNEKLNLGQMTMPEFKYISIDEFNKLTRKQKKECIPDAHWADIYGYSYSNELENDYLILKCAKIDKKIRDFTFDPKSKIITLEWKTFNNCE